MYDVFKRGKLITSVVLVLALLTALLACKKGGKGKTGGSDGKMTTTTQNPPHRIKLPAGAKENKYGNWEASTDDYNLSVYVAGRHGGEFPSEGLLIEDIKTDKLSGFAYRVGNEIKVSVGVNVGSATWGCMAVAKSKTGENFLNHRSIIGDMQ